MAVAAIIVPSFSAVAVDGGVVLGHALQVPYQLEHGRVADRYSVTSCVWGREGSQQSACVDGDGVSVQMVAIGCSQM